MNSFGINKQKYRPHEIELKPKIKMALTPCLVKNLFPKTEFVFFGNYINRNKRQLLRKVSKTLHHGESHKLV